MSQELAIVQQKQTAWSNYAVKLHNGEQSLQLTASEQVNKLSKLPTSIDQVPAAEETLKAAKVTRKALNTTRIELVGPMTAVLERLMLPEKSLDAPIQTMEASIIAIKKAEEQRKAQVQLKINEAKEIELHIQNKLAKYDADCKNYIETTCQKAYEYALGEGNITAKDHESYIEKVIESRGSVQKFAELMPRDTFEPKYHSFEEKAAIVEKFKPTEFNVFADMFKACIISKFINYDLAVQNKEVALARAQREADEQRQQIEREKATAEAMASISANATPLEIDATPTKALKQSFEVDMEENFENAMLILAAFTANVAKCKDKTTTKKWFGFSADSAAKALAKVKSDDNAFAPQGIKFKVVDKL